MFMCVFYLIISPLRSTYSLSKMLEKIRTVKTGNSLQLYFHYLFFIGDNTLKASIKRLNTFQMRKSS